MSRPAMLAAALALGLLATHAPAQAQLTITPTAGQTAEQTQADQAACTNDAVAQTGFHPAAPPPGAQTAQPVVGERARGAARGAAMGAVRESRTDASDREVEDLTEGAARLGAAAGGARQRQDRREARQETQAAEATYAQQQAAYTQVFTSCMTAKGYAVQ